MDAVFSEFKIAVVGGDERELVLISELVKMGAKVTVAGFPREKIDKRAFYADSVEAACNNAGVLILPVPGTSTAGVIRAVYAGEQLELTEKAISCLSENAVIIIGSAHPYLKEWAYKYNYKILEIIELDEFAILNSIPTAEGAIQIAMEETLITIHGSQTCIIGFGRVGLTLARSLMALGSKVTIVSNHEGERARAYEMGCKVDSLERLPDVLNKIDICFNTVPHMVLNKNSLKYSHQDLIIIDLATQPGGTDFEVTNNLGIKAILAPGLPGKVAPISAGKILANVIPHLIIKEMSKLERNLLLG